MRCSSCPESLKRWTKRRAVSWAFCASMILRSHVLELADDSATSQHLMPRPSSSVTKPISAGARCSAWMRLLTIDQFSVREMVDASHLFNSILFFRQPAKDKYEWSRRQMKLAIVFLHRF